MRASTTLMAVFCTLSLTHMGAAAATYQVGPGRAFTNLHQITTLLAPGDVVEVEGNATYPGGVSFNTNGTPQRPITIRGRRVAGKRPVIAGVNGQTNWAVVRILGSHYLLEGFDLTAGGDMQATRGLRTGGDGIVVRDTVVHDCPRHGILGSDAGGSLTLQGVEVHHCGHGAGYHQVYVGADNMKYPGATLRVEHCWFHDAQGGIDLKSRVGRNEIFYNWFERGWYYALDLIGPEGNKGQVRCDSDVVGNLIIKSTNSITPLMRLGGDGSGTSFGRYRFVHNTIILSPRQSQGVTVIKFSDRLESLEMHNNVFWRGGKPIQLFSNPSLKHVSAGACNWVPLKSSFVPKTWTGTLGGVEPGFADAAALDFTPAANSLLVNAARLPTASPTAAPFPNPLPGPRFAPARLVSERAWTPPPRAAWSGDGVLDIGAFQHGEAR